MGSCLVEGGVSLWAASFLCGRVCAVVDSSVWAAAFASATLASVC